jgi:hypothetical protein
VHRCFGAIAPGVARGLKLRHDDGSNYMSGDFQDEIECLGIDPAAAPRRCGGHVAVHGRDKYLNLLACGGVALGSQ